MIILLNTPVRSGSTWAFNVMQDIFNSHNIKYVAKMADDGLSDDSIIKLLKAHGRFNISELENLDLRYITCLRDPKESISSMYRAKNGNMTEDDVRHTLIQSILILDHILEYKSNGGSLLILDYNDIKQNNVKAYMEIIDYLGIAPKNLEEIIENNSKESNIEKLKNRGVLNESFEVIESKTQWHGNHISEEEYEPIDLSPFQEEMIQLNMLYRTLLQKRGKEK